MSTYRPLSQIHSEAPFLQLVQKQPAPASCTDAGFARIVDLAKLLGHAAANITIRNSFPRVLLTGSNGSPRFDSRKSVSLPEATLINPGFWGIFSEAYNNVKTRMLYDELCARFPPNGPPPHIVELGFMKGQSALLFLEAHPNSTVSSFDLGNYRWSRQLAALLQRAYGKQRLVVTFGYTNRTLPKYAATHPRGGKCDVAFIDGDKTRVGRLKDMKEVRRLYKPSTIFFDEATSLDCVSSQARCAAACEADKRHKSDLWGGATLAYCDAAQQGLITIQRCAWPPGMQDMDGICVGTFRY